MESLLVGDHTTAAAVARARLGRNPGDVDALLTLGEVAYETGAFDQALRLSEGTLFLSLLCASAPPSPLPEREPLPVRSVC